MRGEQYDARFASLAAEGAYLHGEADLVDFLLGGPPARVLDAGCGTGRVAVELARRGYEVSGVEIDPEMLDVARAKDPEVAWHLADLATWQAEDEARFDLVIAAGNVMIFVQLGTEAAVVRTLAGAVKPGGLVVSGFQLGRQLPLERYDAMCAAAGLVLEDRWATWDRVPVSGGDYAVSVHRSGEPAGPPRSASSHRARRRAGL